SAWWPCCWWPASTSPASSSRSARSSTTPPPSAPPTSSAASPRPQAAVPAVDGANGDHELARIADEYWEAKLAASPVWASYFGDHRYDDQADDLSAAGEQDLRSKWRGLRDRAAAIDGEPLSATDRATRTLLLEELDDAVRAIDLRLRELMSDQMQGV